MTTFSLPPTAGFHQALAASGHASILSDASQAYRQDISYAEAILNAATKLHLKREAWAKKMGYQEPKVSKPISEPKAAFTLSDLEDLIA